MQLRIQAGAFFSYKKKNCLKSLKCLSLYPTLNKKNTN